MGSTSLACRLCGSIDILTIGGIYGDPFDARPDGLVCARCGKTIEFKKYHKWIDEWRNVCQEL